MGRAVDTPPPAPAPHLSHRGKKQRPRQPGSLPVSWVPPGGESCARPQKPWGSLAFDLSGSLWEAQSLASSLCDAGNKSHFLHRQGLVQPLCSPEPGLKAPGWGGASTGLLQPHTARFPQAVSHTSMLGPSGQVGQGWAVVRQKPAVTMATRQLVAACSSEDGSMFLLL